jgi:RNA polymerase sigma factor (sigma-70 family)
LNVSLQQDLCTLGKSGEEGVNPDPAGDARRLRAFELRQKHYVDLALYAVYLGCSPVEARQVANDSLAQLAIHEFEQPADPIAHERAWLYGVAKRKALEVFRDRPRHVRLGDLPEERLVDSGLGPEEHAEWMEVLDVVRKLPEEYRVPLVLSIRGCSAQEIAARLGCSSDAARQRVCRARKTIRSKLGMDPSPSTSASTTVRAE